MAGWFHWLTNGFMPHGYCLRWDIPLLSVFIIGNLGIALAYFQIPLALRYFVGKRKDLPYPHIFRLFAAFIFSCGLTHLVKVWTLYQPAYWIEAAVDSWTALVSLVTAAVLWPLIPRALELRSPKELEEMNRRLQTEIEERKIAEAEARNARDYAVQANELKSQFVANISHEVRTPMASVIGLVELLRMDESLTDEKREITEHIFDTSKSLLAVLNDLLDFSKLDAGRVEVTKAPFSLRATLDEVLGLFRPVADKKRLPLTVAIDAGMSDALIGDKDKILHTLVNLTHNAIKFTDEGNVRIQIDVKSSTHSSVTARFAVIDTGIGISTDAQQKLFQPFVQADGGISSQYGGTGLGLSIAKRFVELLGGDIGVSSTPGKGSTFWFTAPLEIAANDA